MRVVRVINREAFDAHTDPLFEESKLLKLRQIYLFHLGKFMYLYQNHLLPKSFTNRFIRTNQVHYHDTRNSSLFYLPFCRTNIRKCSVVYQAPQFFNTLSDDIRDASTVSLFQSKLKKYLLML